MHDEVFGRLCIRSVNNVCPLAVARIWGPRQTPDNFDEKALSGSCCVVIFHETLSSVSSLGAAVRCMPLLCVDLNSTKEFSNLGGDLRHSMGSRAPRHLVRE